MANLASLKINDISFIDIIYPIGSIYETIERSFNPNTAFGGTWERIKGRFLVGVDENTPEFNSENIQAGEAYVYLTIGEIPSHNHGLIGEYGASANPSYPPTNNGSYIQAAGTSAGTRQAVGTVINSTGGGRRP